MTRPSEAALKCARELFRGSEPIWYEGNLIPSSVQALARFIDRVSDAAKSANAFVYPEMLRHHLAAFILPEEPCAHETMFRYPPAKTFTCTKCGKSLKLVEAE